MYHKNVSVSLCLLFWIIFFTVSLSLPSLSSSVNVDHHFDDCKPLEAPCGFKIRIAYPFWDSRQQEYCGHPSFKLECVGNSSLAIKIEGQTHYVQSINYETKVFILSKPQFLNGECIMQQSQLTNTTLDLNILNFSSDSQTATLFYDCVSRMLDQIPPYAFSCDTNSFSTPSLTFNNGLGFVAINSTWDQTLRESCSFEIYVPILKTSAVDLANGAANISQVLNRGFGVKWIMDEDGQCEDCANSGGRCGFNQTSNEPTCFCEDGADGRTCGSLLVDNTSTDKPQNWKIIIIVVAVTIGAFTIIFGVLYCLRRRSRPKRHASYGVTGKNTVQHNINDAGTGTGSEDEYQDLPMLKYEQLVLATNNFQESNKLGQGGFGPVYKGKLENGKEIAVKRLSRASGQGYQEFMNEVIVISKLQHKNLVKLLGCSVEGEEKLLVYEFMPNKSLDAFLFGPIQRDFLGWEKRFNIIKGICRGLLYLHRDSRLKIIHRDLKTSNILLDEEFNPKISDFGMARIFGEKQDQANTLRVVGTYGYMSPEYAMEGRFSEKSDMFSLGVLLLEIVCGRRNSIIHDESMSLISYAWKLWNENDIFSLIDPTISDPCFQVEVLRTIHVGLLCVQEVPQDRPSISTVISMLDSEVIDLPQPLQPGFTQSRYCFSADDDVQQQNCSINVASISSVHGR